MTHRAWISGNCPDAGSTPSPRLLLFPEGFLSTPRFQPLPDSLVTFKIKAGTFRGGSECSPLGGSGQVLHTYAGIFHPLHVLRDRGAFCDCDGLDDWQTLVLESMDGSEDWTTISTIALSNQSFVSTMQGASVLPSTRCPPTPTFALCSNVSDLSSGLCLSWQAHSVQVSRFRGQFRRVG